MGSGTVETREAMGFRAVANIEAFVERSVLPDLVVIH
jgi:lactate dehydrogenase-like 2-hydroxyacid dehydrogenase